MVVGAAEAHSRGARLVSAGFAWQKAADATAIDMPPTLPPGSPETIRNVAAFDAHNKLVDIL